jgi:hypothetical protein
VMRMRAVVRYARSAGLLRTMRKGLRMMLCGQMLVWWYFRE